MFAKCLFASLGIAALATPALSAEFYIIQDARTKQCTIVERLPAGSAATMVGDGAFGDRNDAEAEMKVIHACLSQAADSGPRSQDAPPPAR